MTNGKREAFGVKSSKISGRGNEGKIRSNENHSMGFNHLYSCVLFDTLAQ